SSRRRHTRFSRDWSSDVCSSDLKARSVAARERGAPVLAADTTVVLRGRLFGKPADSAEAAEMLRRLQGRKHQVMTAVAVAMDGRDRKSVVEGKSVGLGGGRGLRM